jgi:hypothetical protein
MNRFVHYGLAGSHGFTKRTAGFTGVRPQNIGAVLTDGTPARDPGDLLCRPVERGNQPF